MMKNKFNNEISKTVYRSLKNKLEAIRENQNLNLFSVFYPTSCLRTTEQAESLVCGILEGDEAKFPLTELEEKIILKIASGEGGATQAIQKIWEATKELERDLDFILDCTAEELESYYCEWK